MCRSEVVTAKHLAALFVHKLHELVLLRAERPELEIERTSMPKMDLKSATKARQPLS